MRAFLTRLVCFLIGHRFPGPPVAMLATEQFTCQRCGWVDKKALRDLKALFGRMRRRFACKLDKEVLMSNTNEMRYPMRPPPVDYE